MIAVNNQHRSQGTLQGHASTWFVVVLTSVYSTWKRFSILNINLYLKCQLGDHIWIYSPVKYENATNRMNESSHFYKRSNQFISTTISSLIIIQDGNKINDGSYTRRTNLIYNNLRDQNIGSTKLNARSYTGQSIFFEIRVFTAIRKYIIIIRTKL